MTEWPDVIFYELMKPIRHVVLIILDSVGVGALPDADQYGDAGSNTLAHTAQAVSGLALPHLQRLGLGNLAAIAGVPPRRRAAGAYGRMAEASAGKDTTIGHWELAGLISPRPLPTYPQGFPADLIAAFERRIGRSVLGNKPASGTAIIAELGAEHVRTGAPIVYTSADSVFQIAAHEDVIPVAELYRISQIAREMLVGEHNVGRVIARPFIGSPGNFVRTERRRDFSTPPPTPTVLDHILAAGHTVWAVGKIEDIFAGRGISVAAHTRDNMDSMDKTLAFMAEPARGLIWTNLVDFDMLYGHRNDAAGYAAALTAFDRRTPELMAALGPRDILIITADHGCDPTTPSTDHSREYVPLLIYGPPIRANVNLGIRDTFADVAASVAEWLGAAAPAAGTSFAAAITR